MTDACAIHDHVTPRDARIRFSLLSLLIATTIVSLFLTWLILRRSSDIVALIQVRPSSTSQSLVASTHLSLFENPATLRSVLSDPTVSTFPLIKDQADPSDWLVQHIQLSFAQNSEILTVELRVPARYSGQGQEVLARLVDEYLAAVAKAAPSQEIKLIQPPVITNLGW